MTGGDEMDGEHRRRASDGPWWSRILNAVLSREGVTAVIACYLVWYITHGGGPLDRMAAALERHDQTTASELKASVEYREQMLKLAGESARHASETKILQDVTCWVSADDALKRWACENRMIPPKGTVIR